MGPIRTIALTILTISFFTFVAFFGRLPALRNTPIGALHRVLWIHIPRVCRRLDGYVSGGKGSVYVTRWARVLWYDKHPVVVIIFLLLLSISEFMFLPPAWPRLTSTRRSLVTILVFLPYLFLYLSVFTDPGIITTANHTNAMSLYPYDFINFFPGHICSTCRFVKPARSKHCSICKKCVSRMDHHCIFINNCVGYGNTHWFLLLLLSTALLTSYGAYVGFDITNKLIRERIPSWTLLGTGFSWTAYFNTLAWALTAYTRIGAIAMLCCLTTPLVYGLFIYHVYLLWAGTTTNESMKWADWQVDIADGVAWQRHLSTPRVKDADREPVCASSSWPVEAKKVILRTDGEPPDLVEEEDVGEGPWELVRSMREVENVYDVGLVDASRDVFLRRKDVVGRAKTKYGTGNVT